jgi:hypothetical protein
MTMTYTRAGTRAEWSIGKGEEWEIFLPPAQAWALTQYPFDAYPPIPTRGRAQCWAVAARYTKPEGCLRRYL